MLSNLRLKDRLVIGFKSLIYAPTPTVAGILGLLGAMFILILGIAAFSPAGETESTLIRGIQDDHIIIRAAILYVGITGTASMAGFIIHVLRGKYDRTE